MFPGCVLFHIVYVATNCGSGINRYYVEVAEVGHSFSSAFGWGGDGNAADLQNHVLPPEPTWAETLYSVCPLVHQ
jgi:hypothetical protein